MKELFLNLKNYLETNLIWVNEVRLYNSQDLNPEKHQINPPIILIDFDNLQKSNCDFNTITFDMQVIFKIWNDDLDENYLFSLERRKEVRDLLYNYNQNFFALYYQSENKDRRATHLNLWELNFDCQMIEAVKSYNSTSGSVDIGLEFL